MCRSPPSSCPPGVAPLLLREQNITTLSVVNATYWSFLDPNFRACCSHNVAGFFVSGVEDEDGRRTVQKPVCGAAESRTLNARATMRRGHYEVRGLFLQVFQQHFPGASDEHCRFDLAITELLCDGLEVRLYGVFH